MITINKFSTPENTESVSLLAYFLYVIFSCEMFFTQICRKKYTVKNS